LGIEQSIKTYLETESALSLFLTIKVKVDGLLLYKSSNVSLWTILIQLPEIREEPFLIAIHCGPSKPDEKAFMTDFITEMKSILTNGVTFDFGFFSIHKMFFICDAPARSMIKCIKSHTGYFGCERCEVEGNYVGCVIFDEFNCPKRTDLTFRCKTNKEHHRGTSAIEELPLNMVTDFVLDYMHLICLGVFKRLLHLWLSKGPVSVRLNSIKVKQISEQLLTFRSWIPSDFSRKPRSLSELDRFKATEFC
jgi:hypothetical protein